MGIGVFKYVPLDLVSRISEYTALQEPVYSLKILRKF